MTTPLLPTTEWVFLAGRPPMAEYLGFMSTQMLEGGTAGQQQLADEWRAANDRVKDLTETEAGLADGAEVDPLPEELLPLAEDVLGEPAYMQSFAVVPTELRIVDLNRLVVFQKNINMDYVRELQESLPTDPTIEQVFGFCMAPEGARPPVRSQQVANNAFVFISPSTDFRFLGADLIPHDQAPTAGATGHPTSVVALPVGYGSNYLNVVSVNGRLVLNNGSHRAYALRDAGLEKVPAVIQRITRPEELEVIGPKAVHANPDPYLQHPRPPLLKDYFDPALRKVIRVPRRARQVRITFNVESLDIPG
jgi:hypothetical protein